MKIIDHELKIHPKYFCEVLKGNKTFEVRKNDRNFQAGDTILLREFDGITYSGQTLVIRIKYLLNDEFYGLKKDFVIFSFDIIDEGDLHNENH